jgi:hypothetical protein
MHPLRSIAAAAVLAGTLAGAAEARAESSCATPYVKAQELRLDKKLRAAREELVACAQKSCPAFIQSECSSWLADVEAALPTVVFDVRDASGHPVEGARLLVDGELRQARIDGTSVAVDPGVRKFRVEGAGAPAETHVAVREGEKDRVISITLARAVAPAAAGDAVTAPPGAEASDAVGTAGVPWSAWALGGLGTVALGSFAFFAISGYSAQLDMEHGCAPYCSESRMTSLRARYLAADVSLGVAALAAAGAVWIALSSRDRVRAGIATSPSGAAAFLRTTF